MNRLHNNTVKIKTDYGSIFVHVETDIPCNIVGFTLATPQKIENTALGAFVDQLKYEDGGAQ